MHEQVRKRLVSLDAFRGLTILGMLLVNNIALGTATPSQFLHAEWNKGVHLADLVFPWFLLIVGVAVPYAAASRRKKGVPWRAYFLKVINRSLALVLLGCLIDSSINKYPTFGLGVLQLIGLAYLFGALLYQIPIRWRIATAALFLLVHWAAIRFIPVPGLGVGIFNETGNLITYINRIYLGPYHLKGLISVVPTTALVLIGTVIGDMLRSERRSEKTKVLYLTVLGTVLALLGFIWNLDLPFNKPVWSASYILLAAGLGSAVLGLFYLLIDIKGWAYWSYPLVVFGANAITAYVLPILVKVYILQQWTWKGSQTLQQSLIQFYVSRWGPITGGWVYTLAYMVFWWIVLLYLYRKKIFLRV